MSTVWICVPSKRPPAEVKLWAEAWRDMGYRLAIWRDEPMWRGDEQWGWMTPALGIDPESDPLFVCGCEGDQHSDPCLEGKRGYPGYAQATNTLIRVALNQNARWCVIGGDDVFPDRTKRADEIAEECEWHFEVLQSLELDTFGVMQPTGDTWGDKQGPYIERVAGSAWIGREFALRAYGGNGPLWPEYRHIYADEELWHVAQKLGVYWQRPDLTQIHQHWGRPRPGEKMGLSERMPDFLKEANSPEHWKKYRAIFEARRAANFPGHEVKA